MPAGLIPALGNLTSITGGGAFQASVPTSSDSDAASGVGPVNIGGLNVPALPGDNRTILIAAVVLGAAFLFSRRKKR